tara:strand:- start:241 stop:531 length:291 start_codon:yes stop_codon:yes gene_type:complete
MSNFLEEIETIKSFHKFLGIVISQVENGEKVNFKSVSKLSKIIKSYFTSCEQGEDDTNENNKDKFLNDILSGEYNSSKVRKSIIDFNGFKKNVFVY